MRVPGGKRGNCTYVRVSTDPWIFEREAGKGLVRVWTKSLGWTSEPEAIERALSFLGWAINPKAAKAMRGPERKKAKAVK